MVEGILGIIGVILGFLLSEVTAYFRARRDEEREIINTRALLRIEMEQNLETLQSLIWKPLQGYEHPGMTSEGAKEIMNEFNRYSVLHELEPPSWDNNAWNSVKAFIPKALSDEEIKKIYKHHGELEHLNAIHFEILKLETLRESASTAHAKEQLHYAQKDIYEKRYEPQVKLVLEIGNPLAGQVSQNP